MIRLVVLALVVVTFILTDWVSGGNLGASSECRNAECLVTASSSVPSLIVASVLALLLAYYRYPQGADDRVKVVGVWRRLGAFLIDFVVVLVIVSPFGAIPILIAEGHYSGTFQWAFTRHYSRATDVALISPSAFVAFLALYLYFYLYSRSNRATTGQFILGYRVVAQPGSNGPNYALRVLLSFVGLCAWPISLFLALRRPEKSFWWDQSTHTRVTRVAS
jgi:uncharacterized RDD family membrane protein YckC